MGRQIRILHLLLLALTFFAAGCGDSVEKAKDQARQVVAAATNALANYKVGDPSNFSALRLQLRAMKASLATNDFTTARTCAAEVDKLLKTKMVAQSIEFLRIEASEGAQKAKGAITEFMAQNNLEVTETKICQELLRHFDEMDKRQTADLVAAVVYISLERKMSHSAAIPAAFTHMVMEELLGIATNSPPSGQAAKSSSE